MIKLKRKYTVKIKVIKTSELPKETFPSTKAARIALKKRKGQFSIVRILGNGNLVLKCEKCEYRIGTGFNFCPRCGNKTTGA